VRLDADKDLPAAFDNLKPKLLALAVEIRGLVFVENHRRHD
jgi:hypothetical protein